VVQEAIRERFFWTKEDIERLPLLPAPVETFDLAQDESKVIRVERWELFKHLITPRWPGAPPEKLTLALRVWMVPGYEGPRAPYWDIHQSHLIAILVPILQRPNYRDLELTIIKRDRPPRAFFEVIPKRVA